MNGKHLITRALFFSFVALNVLISCKSVEQEVSPQQFVSIDSVAPHIEIEPRYYQSNNFIGKRINGYQSPKCIVTKAAVLALKKVQNELNKNGFGLKVFDAYRPQRAVNHFIKWAQSQGDTLNKSIYYPNIKKSELFKLGYISEQSGHSRGSTLDLTIIILPSKQEMDMGSPFDFFGPISGHKYEDLSQEQKSNRMLLRDVMEKHGFEAYEEEWWHYTLINEPFPKSYFDFPVR